MPFFQKIPLSILALTLSAFCIGSGEFVIMGLLMELAKDLSVSVNQAGLLVTAYALGVVIGGPFIAVLTFKFPRKQTLIGLVSVFVLGNILCALANNYSFLILARIVTASCHGTFFGLATVAAIKIVPLEKQARAVALVFMGTTLANMLGVPVGTALGFSFGWRATFWAIAVLGLFSVAGLVKYLPNKNEVENIHLKQELNVFKKRNVQIPLLLSALLNGGLFVVYTYISPILMTVLQVPENRLSVILFLFGAGLPVATYIGGRLGDWNLLRSLTILLTGLIGVLMALYVSFPHQIVGIFLIFLWCMMIFTIAPMLQLMTIQNSNEAPHLSSTFNQSAFNLGNAFGAWVGSVLLGRHFELTHLPLASAVFFACALAFVFYYKRKIIKKEKIC
jgi:MFS transporter, DHA1 family, inner membrane transport protein